MFKKSYYRQVVYGMIVAMVALVSLLLQPKAYSQGGPSEKIESDDPRVIQSGDWSSQSASPASNGGYLFSGGAEVDVLALAFVGNAIEIIYVAGPQFGTLAVEVDGTVLRTIITTSDKIAYAQSTRLDYLSNEPHSLKVYAQSSGVVAIDAFHITPLSSVGEGSGVRLNSDDGTIQSSPCAPLNAIHRVSLTSTGAQATNDSTSNSLSATGRYVAFRSTASLVAGDGDAIHDIYVYDRQTCTVQLVSTSSTGVKGNGTSASPSISADGRYVAFHSTAANLVSGDTNVSQDVFVHDRQTSTTTRVSVASGGVQASGASSDTSISADGRYVAFSSIATDLVVGDTNAQSDIFVHDRQTNTTTRVSLANGGVQATSGNSIVPALSADGRYVAFESTATNLVSGDTNVSQDVFVHDRQTGNTTRVSVATGGTQATGGGSVLPAISADGRYVAFQSTATNLVSGDTNLGQDVFVHDRQTSTTTRVSVATGGAQAPFGGSREAKISADGRYMTFRSIATDLVVGDTNGFEDVFVHDRQTGTTTRVSVAASGAQGTDDSFTHSISADGRYVSFNSFAPNLVSGDTNGALDIFVTPRTQPTADTLALFNPAFNHVDLINTLADSPPLTAYTAFSAYAPVANGQWVMGDWNGDGLDTPGVYNNGPFFYTNKTGESQPADWRSLWIGVAGPPVSGRFNGALANDCIGAVQTASLGGSTVFVLYLTCDLSGNTLPTISNQWLSSVLPDAGGFSGTHQFKAGDFNSDGVDSIAVRRGTFIAFGNVAPATGPATFDLAQFIGTPAVTDAGSFVVGDWDANGADSFGLFYQSGEFFYRNDLTFNSGVYVNQSVGVPFAGTVQATTWR